MSQNTTRGTAKTRKAKEAKRNARGLPSREQILEFLAANPKAGKREIGRAFQVKGSAKIDLKALLKEMAEEGVVEKRGKRIVKVGTLPPVTVIDIVARDRNGGLLARAAEHYTGDDEKAPVIRVEQPRGKNAVVAGIGSRALARLTPVDDETRGADYVARVIKLLDKNRDLVLGIIRKVGSELRLEPVNKRQDELVIAEVNDGRPGDLVEVKQIRSQSRYGLKRARVERVIGSMESEKAVSMIAIHANGIPHVFPDEVLQEADSAKLIDVRNTPSHEDWRDLPLITIDPADAKDHDDAIFGEPDPDVPGGHVVTVAIADVSFYVRPGSAMDREALKRGNSVYFPDRVVPMLPERISNDLCSLREDEVRPALAVQMKFTPEGKKRSHSFHRILMRSHAKLAYTEAQAAIDGTPNDKTGPILEPVLKPLWEAYRCLKRGRSERAPLELDLPERKILLKEDGTVDRVIVPDRLDAHKLVEEFMIQANVSAAETLEQRQQELIYRVHDKPSLDKMEALSEFLRSMSLSIVRSGNIHARDFNGILARVDGTDQEELVNQVVLRSQSQAEYTPENIGHFGLNLRKYAHFTSPIRRYADLIVHRALVKALGLGPGGITPEEEDQLDVIAADISLTERRAMAAERETIDRLIAGFLSERIGDRFMGRINGVTKAGMFVTLADTGADGFIPISQISDEYWHYDPATHSLIGADSETAYQMGMEVEVRLVEAAPVAGALRFEMLSGGKPSKGLPRSRKTNTRAGAKPGRRSGPSRGGPPKPKRSRRH